MATPAEIFQSQPIDAQMNQIRAWFQQNPTATEADINTAMQQYGLNPQIVAQALGNMQIPNAPASIQFAQYQNITGNRSDINDINRAIVARNLGVSADELASLGGMTPEQAQALTARASQQNPGIGQVSQDQIRAFVMANPNMSDQQFYQMMNRYGVDPIQVSQAIGVDVTDVLQRQQNAAQQNAEFIPTGLSGFEQATQRGLADVTGTLRSAQQEAMGYLDPAMEEVARLYNLNIEGLGQAGTQARGDIERTFGTASGYFDPYRQAGTTALQQQLALSGALGQTAFNQAYQESPYVQFLREQGERSTLAGAAATGGLGGGRVQQELVRFGQGLASQGLQQQIQNLQALSGQGLQAAGAGANVQTGMGTNLANIGTGIARDIAGQRQGLASERMQYGTNLANLATSTGTNIANVQGAAAQNIASQRALAGQQLADQIANTSINLGNLANAQGTGLSNLLSNYGMAGLNLSQTYLADQIAAQQAAAQQEAQAQENYAGQQSGMLSGQPFYQQQPFSYGQMFGNAANAAALGYQLAGPPAGSQYTRPTQLPVGMGNPVPVAGGSPSSYLNSSSISSALAGAYRR